MYSTQEKVASQNGATLVSIVAHPLSLRFSGDACERKHTVSAVALLPVILWGMGAGGGGEGGGAQGAS